MSANFRKRAMLCNVDPKLNERHPTNARHDTTSTILGIYMHFRKIKSYKRSAARSDYT